MNKHFQFFLLLFLIVPVSFASADIRPFLFTFALPAGGQNNGSVHFDAGWGNGSLGFSEDHLIDQRIGAVVRLNSRWVVDGNIGFGKDTDSDTIFSGQARAFFDFVRKSESKFRFAAGGGLRWERDGSPVVLAALTAGWQADTWRLDGNVIFEKASSPDRDPLDLIVSMGWLRKVSRSFSMGVETVAQDLEGFWEANEAEGGARIFVGPAIHFASARWEGGLAGGYVFRPTFSNRTSPADRPFGSNRLLLQISIGRTF